MSAVIGIFRSRRTGRAFAKRYHNKAAAYRAASALRATGKATPLGKGPKKAKGFHFGQLVKRLNRHK